MAKKWVSASEIGRAQFCAHAMSLEKNNAKPTKEAILMRERGNASHDEIGHEIDRATRDSRCYIASCVYGFEHENTNALRAWRDSVLMTCAIGRVAVKAYYLTSPVAVRVIGKSTTLTRVCRLALNCLFGKVFKQFKDKGE